MLRRRHFIASLALAGLTSACVAPEPVSTDIALSITGAGNMNGGAPAQVKVYYLSNANQFQSSDFFTVFDTPESLGSDLIEVSTFSLVPGRTVTDSKNFVQPPAAIGVVAAFRDINGQFLAVKPLVPNVPNPVAVTLSGNSVVLR
jgi:type VI secretion system protein VasD